MAELAHREHSMADSAAALGRGPSGDDDPSLAAFEAVLAAVQRPNAPPPKKTVEPRRISLADGGSAQVSRSGKRLRLELGQGEFSDWVEQEAGVLLNELYQRWQDQRR